MASYKLDNAAEIHREASDTFWLPPLAERQSLRAGDFAKLIFRIKLKKEVHVERMWVRVSEIRPETYVGILDNDPYCTEKIRSGMRVEFHADHIIQIERGDA